MVYFSASPSQWRSRQGSGHARLWFCQSAVQGRGGVHFTQDEAGVRDSAPGTVARASAGGCSARVLRAGRRGQHGGCSGAGGGQGLRPLIETPRGSGGCRHQLEHTEGEAASHYVLER